LMRRPGDFFLLPDVDLTRATLTDFQANAAAEYLVEICLHWYSKPPRAIAKPLRLADAEGAEIALDLTPLALDGAW
jgi:hypothetical protein